MKKILLIVGATLVVLIAAAGALVWYFMGKPMYEPGAVAASRELQASLTPAAGWTVEPGIALHHFEHGAGRRVSVIHGGPGIPFTRPLPGLEPLSDRFSFVYYDQRGCGRSTRPLDRFASSNFYDNLKLLERTLGLAAQIADIERIRRVLGDERLVLMGHSFGAFLASLYAAEFPDRVAAMLLVAPASVLVMPVEGEGLFGEVRRLLPREMAVEYSDYLKSYFDYRNLFTRSEAELSSLNARFGKYYRAAAKARGFPVPGDEDAGSQGGWMVEAMYFSMGKRHDYRPALKKATAPVLVVHGRNDIQPEQASRVYSDSFPNAEFRVLPHSGHFPFLDQPAEFSAAAGAFLDRVK